MAYSLMGTLRKYEISVNLVRTTEHLYDEATRTVQMIGSTEECFRTTV